MVPSKKATVLNTLSCVMHAGAGRFAREDSDSDSEDDESQSVHARLVHARTQRERRLHASSKQTSY